MKPVKSNLRLKPEDGCTKISSSCVIWQGPDIPCIELCKGDSITDVIYDLATKLCEMTTGIIDISTLDFKCLVPSGAAEPTSLVAALQLIIDKQCYFEDNCCDSGSGGTGPVPISLPACLYYTDGGDEITSLLPSAYSQYLATKICEVIDDITSINLSITNLQGRVTTLEANSGTGGGTAAGISIVSQCASNNSPGIVTPIGQAFSAFESKFCQLTTLIGTNAALTTAIGKECVDLDSASQLSNPSSTMSDLAGWIATPTTLSETIVNMWLTICDMRNAIVDSISTVLPCIGLPVSNLQITNLLSTGSTITWNAPNTGLVSEAPLSYLVKVYEWNGTSTVGSPIVNATKPFGTNSHTITLVQDPTKNYQVQVIAEYSCEDSPVTTVVGKIALTSLEYCVEVTDAFSSNINTTCGGEIHSDIQNITTVTLKSASTGLVSINTGAPITVVLEYQSEGDCDFGASLRSFVIPTGSANATYTYFAQLTKKCAPTEPCTTVTKQYSCGSSINTDRAIFCAGVLECIS